MTDKNDHPETQPVRPTPAAGSPTPQDPPTPAPESPTTAPDAPTPASPAPPQRTVGERLRTTRGLIAATLAAFIIGGIGGAVVHAAVDGGPHDRGRFERGAGFGGPGLGGPGPGGPAERGRDIERAPGDVPGELPSTTAPEDEESSNS